VHFTLRQSSVRLLAVGAVAAAAVAAGGCGSSSSSGGSTSAAGSSSSSSAAAATTSATAATTSATASTSSGVAQAQQIVASAEVRPTKISATEQITTAIPKGKKIVYIGCGNSDCSIQANLLKAAGAKLGWTVDFINTDGSPQGEQSAFSTAINQKPNAIILNAETPALFSSLIKRANAAGIQFVTCCSTATAGGSSGVLYNVSTPQQDPPIGDDLAAYAVASEKGKATTLYVDVSAFQILSALNTSFKAELAKLCPSCGYNYLDISEANIGTPAMTSEIVSAARAHHVNVIALSLMSLMAPGLHAALVAAGLPNVEIEGQSPGPADYTAMKAGTENAGFPFDYLTVDYLMLNSLVDKWTGKPVVETPPPLWLITSKQVTPALEKQATPEIIPGYQQQFYTLWGIK
jgi:ribose transport system substrate-binding protein